MMKKCKHKPTATGMVPIINNVALPHDDGKQAAAMETARRRRSPSPIMEEVGAED